MGNSSHVSRCADLDIAPSRTRGIQKKTKKHAADTASYWHDRMRENQASQDLFDAAVNGNVKAAMMALVAHGNPNCANPEGLTSLMMAAAGGHLEVARLLVTSGGKVNSTPLAHRISPLGLATAQGNLEMVRLLLQWRADPNVGAISGNAPLSRAAAAGHLKVCLLLLEHSADPDAYDEHGVTAAMNAVDREHLEVTQLLINHGASMARADHRSSSALSRVVDVLLRMDPLGKASNGLRSPLSEYDYWTEMTNIMVERHADVNIVDGQGDTLLSKCVRHRRKDVILTLLNLGADQNFPVPSVNAGGALSLATELGNRDLCQTLILRSASVNQQNSSGVTPLCTALDNGDEEMCFYLLQSGAHYNLRDPRSGETLLMKAAAQGLRKVYDYLRPYIAVDAVSHEHGFATPPFDDDESVIASDN